MSLLHAQGLCLSFADRDLLKDITFSVNVGSRLALVGANGCGKTTLLNILATKAAADRGTLVRRKGLRLSYLPQSGLEFRGRTLRGEVETAFGEYDALLFEMDRLGSELQKPDLPEAKMQALLEEHHAIQEHIEQSGYYSRGMRIQEITKGLGFSASDLDRACGEFSGGWQMRIGLAKVLLQYPDVMLLDEPTNYLDLEAREWLKEFLKVFHGAVILVSHDRYFLDETVTAIAELYQSRLRLYPGCYSAYEAKRQLELEQVMAAWKKQQEEIAHLESFIGRFQYKATKATQAQSRIKQLEKMERIELPDGLRKLEFRFPAAPSCSEVALTVDGLSRDYPGKRVLAEIGFELRRGEKLAILGKNGAGKSTLMRILSGHDDGFGGELRLGNKVKTAYFAQDAEATLNPENTVFEEIEQTVPDHPPQGLRNLLGAFLFSGDDIDKPIGVLSGGEKSRVALVKMLLSPANVLILDEPTNHLDLTSKDVLLSALRQFEGAVVFVSHDRQFIQKLATSLIELRPSEDGQPSRFIRYLGDWDYFQWKVGQEGQPHDDGLIGGAGQRPSGAKAASASSAPAENHSAVKAQREEQKQLKAQLRRMEKQEETILLELEAIEAKRKALNDQLGQPEVYTDGAATKRLQLELAAVEAKEAKLQGQWEAVCQEIEELRPRAEGA
jgi:ATP-binding cassette subfamily F protein 3